MASIQERNGKYRVQFLHHGKRYSLQLGKVPEKTVLSKKAKVEELLALLESGYVQMPPGVDIVGYLKHDGKPPTHQVAPEAGTLSILRDRFLAACKGAVEANTYGLFEGHFKRLELTFGVNFPLANIELTALQRHADRRKGQVSLTTIRKEFSTLRAAWNWGIGHKLTSGTFPSVRRVKLPKLDEKPPFQTWAQAEKSGQWDSLYLTVEETTELLAYIKERAVQPWVYPMCALAAYTGMRRSELLRAMRSDIDVASGVITVRERKRARTQRTTRRIPLAPTVQPILNDWLMIHPGGNHLFTQHEVERSKKKRAAPVAVTRDEAHDHLKRCLFDSKWAVIRGYHLLRHSFISACASKGIDQRFIDEWVSHSTEEQRRRYRHLFPSTQQEAIGRVFG